MKDGWGKYNPTDPENWLHFIACACTVGFVGIVFLSLVLPYL